MEKTGILRHQIRIDAETSRLCELRERIYHLCENEGVPPQSTRLMVLAIDEAMSNIIEHAKLEADKKEIKLWLEIGDEKIVAGICDKGRPFDPTPARREPDTRSYPRRGFGLYLIHRIVDGIQYQRTNEGQNVLTLTKSIE